MYDIWTHLHICNYLHVFLRFVVYSLCGSTGFCVLFCWLLSDFPPVCFVFPMKEWPHLRMQAWLSSGWFRDALSRCLPSFSRTCTWKTRTVLLSPLSLHKVLLCDETWGKRTLLHIVCLVGALLPYVPHSQPLASQTRLVHVDVSFTTCPQI